MLIRVNTEITEMQVMQEMQGRVMCDFFSSIYLTLTSTLPKILYMNKGKESKFHISCSG